MKRIIEWMRRWSFLLLVVSVGVGYLTVGDYWEVYAKPLQKLQEWQPVEILPKEVAGEDTIQVSFAEGRMENSIETLIENPIENSIEDSVSDSDAAFAGAQEESLEGNVNRNEMENRREMENRKEMESEQSKEVIDEIITNRSEEAVVYKSVEDDYFQDALFIGDSRTVGMYEYAGLEDIATFYASTGLTIYKLFDAPIVEVEGQRQNITVEQALSENSFSKIYLMIGINEMGTGTVDSFMETYAQTLEHLRQLQPDATIYLQGIMKVTAERSEKGDYITNAGIEERNERIAELADNVNIYYLDVNSVLCDETGGMESSYTFDGVHLKAQYVTIWKDYLKSHAVDESAICQML